MVKQVQKCIAFRCARLTVPHSPEGDKTIIWLKLVLYPPIPLKLRLKSLKQIWQWKVCSRRYSQRAWTWVVGCGLSWPHKSGSSPPYCGWHSWHSSAASHKVWVEHKLQNENERNVKITTSYMGQNTKTTCEVLQEKKTTTITLTVKDASLRDVSHGRRLHDVPDDKLLDGLVLWDTAGTVGAADGLHMATAFLGTTVIPPFLSL